MPPLLSERSPVAQIFFVVLVPAAYGAGTGLALGSSKSLYTILTLLSVIGGVLAGIDHADGGEAFRRGAVGGLVFGSFILIAHRATGDYARTTLPDPQEVLAVVTMIGGGVLAWVGAAIFSPRRTGGAGAEQR